MKKNLLLMALFVSLIFAAQNVSPGQNFPKGSRFQSPSKNYYLIFQEDGNLVLYSKRTNMSVWDTKTGNSGVRAGFQPDGNLVVYNNSNRPVYSTNTQNRGAVLKIQDDGNLVVYNNNGSSVWSSVADRSQHGGVSAPNNKTIWKNYRFAVGEKLYSGNRQYYLTFQQDGNLVMYSKNNTVLWDSKTGNRGARAEFQNDGNLAVYNRLGQPLFATNTENRGASKMVIQNDGNLVIYDDSNNPLWGSDNSK